jgi:hypothetical protein
MRRRRPAGSGSGRLMRIPAWLSGSAGAPQTWLEACLLRALAVRAIAPRTPSVRSE